jgi:hypothetical protein
MVIVSPFYKQLKQEIRMNVADQAIQTINNLSYLVKELYPDDPATQEMLNIDEVLEQAQITVYNLSKKEE